ncbi:MAG TPA: hypothetical protein VMW13_09950 [Dehalococcoidales bacterium]|nr:hypothetical protein [Dehalococcoidales bacterium]
MELQKEVDAETGQEMIQLLENGCVIARIYPHPEGIRIVSEYLDGVEHEAVMPPALVVKFTRGVVLESETPEEGGTLLAGWPCCACDEMIMDDPDASVVLVDKLATWEYPSWGNILEGSGGRASASLCGRCTNEERPPKYAIRNEGEVHIRVPLDELEDLEGERE